VVIAFQESHTSITTLAIHIGRALIIMGGPKLNSEKEKWIISTH
jgi:hypothetical protein